ncbi:MAG: DUF1731 domain-containing protein [Terracidiphilus sp.]
MAALREAWDVPNGLPAPAPLIAIGTFLLRSEPELVLKSRRAVPGRLLQSGFQFEFPIGQKPLQISSANGARATISS